MFFQFVWWIYKLFLGLDDLWIFPLKYSDRFSPDLRLSGIDPHLAKDQRGSSSGNLQDPLFVLRNSAGLASLSSPLCFFNSQVSLWFLWVCEAQGSSYLLSLSKVLFSFIAQYSVFEIHSFHTFVCFLSCFRWLSKSAPCYSILPQSGSPSRFLICHTQRNRGSEIFKNLTNTIQLVRSGDKIQSQGF